MKEVTLHFKTAHYLKNFARKDCIYFHPVQESKRSIQWASKLKRMGMIAGVSDFVIFVDGQLHFLELKSEKGRLSPAQKAWRDLCHTCGAGFHVTRTLEDTIALLKSIKSVRE